MLCPRLHLPWDDWVLWGDQSATGSPMAPFWQAVIMSLHLSQLYPAGNCTWGQGLVIRTEL